MQQFNIVSILKESENLCNSIFVTQRLAKNFNKKKSIHEEILESQKMLLRTKAEEKVTLILLNFILNYL